MASVASREIEVEGRPARVWVGGAGAPLLLLHGGVGPADLHWRGVWGDLAETFHLIAPDFPGFGGTAPIPGASFARMTSWVAALLDALAISRAAVVGNSFGAAVARFFGAAYPERTSQVVLVNGGAAPPIPAFVGKLMTARIFDGMFESIRKRTFTAEGLSKMIADPALLTPAFVRESEEASQGFVRAMREAGTAGLPAAQTPKAPTLVVWGMSDRLVKPKVGEKLCAEIPGARFHGIDGGGHMPQLERPAEFTAILREFCGEPR